MNFSSLIKTGSTAFKTQAMNNTANSILLNFVITLFITFAVTMLIEWVKEKARLERIKKQEQLA